ncbi:MAG: hypothetical protein QOI04_952 [Verrucomicrobiota bacterium]|jgi:hypothetical protein
MTLPAWFQRMNRRERMLALIVGGIVFVLVNLVICNSLLGMLGSARTELVARKSARSQQALYLKEASLWSKRSEWLTQHQPTLKNASEASSLLDQVKQLGAKQNVLIENPAIGTGETTPDHQTVFASIETKSPWPALVHFLYDLQQPASFVVFENVSINVDGNDQTMMRGKFKIARWFAPAQRRK